MISKAPPAVICKLCPLLFASETSRTFNAPTLAPVTVVPLEALISIPSTSLAVFKVNAVAAFDQVGFTPPVLGVAFEKEGKIIPEILPGPTKAAVAP